MEIWKPIEGFEGRYEVSCYGRIRSVSRPATGRNWPCNGKVLKTGFRGGRKEKYPWITLSSPPIRTSQSIHRLVAIAFVPNPERKPEVNHKDGNKLNNHYDNLEWCTRKENTQHASKARLLWDKGIHFNAKLNLKTVFKIKRQLLNKMKPREIATKYNVNISSVYSINSGKSWKHITI